MTDQFVDANKMVPITPPPELFAEWFASSLKTLDRTISEDDRGTTGLIAGAVAIQAARWGADQELEACCEWVDAISGKYGPRLRLARRPKPPSLAEQALKELTDWTDEKHGAGGEVFLCEGLSVIKIRTALERLQELENNG